MDEKPKMPSVTLSDEDFEHFRDWQRLSSDEKEAITKIAKILGSEEKRKSFYTLLEAQTKLSELLVTAGHLSWFGRVFLKAGVVTGVILGFFTLWAKATGKQ